MATKAKKPVIPCDECTTRAVKLVTIKPGREGEYSRRVCAGHAENYETLFKAEDLKLEPFKG